MGEKSVRDRVRARFEAQVAAFETSSEFRGLTSGSWPAERYRDFIANVARVHLNSPRIMAFMFSVAPPAVSATVAANMVEELGRDGPDTGHPRLLEALLERSGVPEAVCARVRTDSDDLLRNLACDPLLFGTLRELGFSVLLEVSSFEWMLSRLSGRMGRALATGLGLDAGALGWFFLHSEVDVRHAEESLETIEAYAREYGFDDEGVETFLDLTFRENVYLSRYFFKSYVSSIQTGAAGGRTRP
jgi:hypothetical protein